MPTFSMALPSKTQEIDSGCPGSDRSTLWLSYLQSKRASPSTRSNSKSKENISTSLYNLEEETFPPSPRPRLAGDQAPVTPRDIVQLNTDFVASITIEQLANRAGVSRKDVRNWIRGRSIPKTAYFVFLLKALSQLTEREEEILYTNASTAIMRDS